VAYSRVCKETRGFGAHEPKCSLPAHNLRYCIECNIALILNDAQFHYRDAQLFSAAEAAWITPKRTDTTSCYFPTSASRTLASYVKSPSSWLLALTHQGEPLC